MEETTLWVRKKDNNRREIIRAARNLFEKQGYHKTTVKALCEAAGISKGTFFNYFGSKDTLIQIIFDSAFNDIKEDIDSRYGDEGEPVQALESILKSMLQDAISYPELCATAHELMFRSKSFNSYRRHYESLVMKYVIKAIDQEKFRPDVEAEFAMKMIMGAYYSLTFEEYEEDKTDEIADQLAAKVKAVLNLFK